MSWSKPHDSPSGSLTASKYLHLGLEAVLNTPFYIAVRVHADLLIRMGQARDPLSASRRFAALSFWSNIITSAPLVTPFSGTSL
ncbi:unnamed protein product [Parascedosporium putredinis]|uniref:Uncharacterized protein n=1 Tax=Parascedosporium putredinis TaxID=1442378 RepID=A0A9P1GW04_9PEZI|nr:unnamed protein product [Parascedosporium putredinis]CAI7988990.1 unnamed protein product [Parascedosporium putredinis]